MVAGAIGIVALVVMVMMVMVVFVVVLMRMLVMMLMFMVLVAAAVGIIALMVVVMVVFVLVIVMMLMFVVMVVFVLVLMIVVVMMLVLMMLMAAAVGIIALVVMMMVLMLVVMHRQLVQCALERVGVLDGGEDLLAAECIPGRRDDRGVGVHFAQQRDGGVQLLLRQLLGAGEDDGAGVADLIVIEFAEVFRIHLALINVCNRGEGIEPCIFKLRRLHSADNVRKLTYARGLNNNALGVIFLRYLLKCL